MHNNLDKEKKKKNCCLLFSLLLILYPLYDNGYMIITSVLYSLISRKRYERKNDDDIVDNNSVW